MLRNECLHSPFGLVFLLTVMFLLVYCRNDFPCETKYTLTEHCDEVYCKTFFFNTGSYIYSASSRQK